MSRFVSLIRFILGFIVIMVLTTIVMAVCVVLLPFRLARIYVCNWWGHTVGRSIVFLAGVTPKVNGWDRLEGSMPAIFVMNHASTLDAFSGIWMAPYGACGVFKKEIVKVPFYGQLAWISGHLLLDRNNTGKAVETLKNMATFMQKNRLGIWIFPEGTRARDGRLQPFKKGFVHIAIATGFREYGAGDDLRRAAYEADALARDAGLQAQITAIVASRAADHELLRTQMADAHAWLLIELAKLTGRQARLARRAPKESD